MSEPRYRFPLRMRIRRPLDFKRAYSDGRRTDDGGLVVYARSNELLHPRLGISIGRRVGGAVVRNRIKRLLREAFRLEQHAIGAGVDLVVVVRPHRARAVGDYAQVLRRAALRRRNGIDA